MTLPEVAVASDENPDSHHSEMDRIVVKLALNSDGTPGAIYSVTPVSLTNRDDRGGTAAVQNWQAVVELARKTEERLIQDCEQNIKAAIAELHRLSRHVSRHDIERAKLATVRQCNIPCAEKMKYGFTRYDSLARVHQPADRRLAGEDACADVKPLHPGSNDWKYSRRFADAAIVGRGQYTNVNWPIFGLYYNPYNPYGNSYFPFSPYPYIWRSGPWAWMIYFR